MLACCPRQVGHVLHEVTHTLAVDEIMETLEHEAAKEMIANPDGPSSPLHTPLST